MVAYYFPPMGLSGVQRITKFVKYLPDFGWKPTVLTVEPGGYFAFDPELENEVQSSEIRVVRTQSLDPTRLFKRKSTVSLPAESSRKWMSSISQALFIPDNKVGWVRPAVRRALALHEETPFDVILATVPPYSAALVARKVAKKTGVPFVVDYRDDWLDNPRHAYPTPIHRYLHQVLEKNVLLESAAVVSINERICARIKGRLHSYSADPGSDRVRILPQGYDREDLAGKQSLTKGGMLTLLYSGVFYDAQTPDFFLKALSGFINENPDYAPHIRAVFVGLVPESSKALAESLGLAQYIEYTGYVSHSQAIKHVLGADILWMTVGEGKGQELISTSKLFEYMGTQKPILGLVPEGAAKDALMRYKASWVVSPGDIQAIHRSLETIYMGWDKGLLPEANADYVEQIERKNLTGQLSELLDRAAAL